MKGRDRMEGRAATGGHLRRDRGVISSERGGTLVRATAYPVAVVVPDACGRRHTESPPPS